MINESRPTQHACHIEIQCFAIQEWRKHGVVVMEHLSGLLTPSEGLTKAVGWVLHARHARHSMGHFCFGSIALALRPIPSPALSRS